jgi:hypothetical protein
VEVRTDMQPDVEVRVKDLVGENARKEWQNFVWLVGVFVFGWLWKREKVETRYNRKGINDNNINFNLVKFVFHFVFLLYRSTSNRIAKFHVLVWIGHIFKHIWACIWIYGQSKPIHEI